MRSPRVRLATSSGRFGTWHRMPSVKSDRIPHTTKVREDIMQMKLSLVKGRTKWVDHNEARMLQRQGQVVCVLAVKDEQPVEFPPFCTMRNDYCSSCVSLSE